MTANAMPGDRDRCINAGMDDYIAKPVRPEEVRKTIEHWGPECAAAEPARSAEAQTATGTGAPAAPAPAPAPAPAAPADPPPVDMDRLNDFTNGNPDDLRDLMNLYLKQTSAQIEQLAAAVKAANAPEVRRVSHSCAGASATCGMTHIVPFLRQLEHQSEEGNLANAAELSRQVEVEFRRIQTFIEAQLAQLPDLTSQPQP